MTTLDTRSQAAAKSEPGKAEAAWGSCKQYAQAKERTGEPQDIENS